MCRCYDREISFKTLVNDSRLEHCRATRHAGDALVFSLNAKLKIVRLAVVTFSATGYCTTCTSMYPYSQKPRHSQARRWLAIEMHKFALQLRDNGFRLSTSPSLTWAKLKKLLSANDKDLYAES